MYVYLVKLIGNTHTHAVSATKVATWIENHWMTVLEIRSGPYYVIL